MRPEGTLWRSFERAALPNALFGSAGGSQPGTRLNEALARGMGVALGYPADQDGGAYLPPSAIALDDNAAPEVMSWLRAYAPQTSPLSQFAPVLLRSDWERFAEGADDGRGPAQPRAREDLWACIVTGELLAQGDIDGPGSVPISRGASCFSTSIARSALLYRDDAYDECVRRLSFLERDPLFARRQVSTASLKPIWETALRRPREALGVPAAVEAVLGSEDRRAETPADGPGSPPQGGEVPPDLASDSVEARLVAFMRFASQALDGAGDGEPAPRSQLTLAASAFLVGRGSSHGFLLARLGRRWAPALAWFGLLCGLAGPDCWDARWSRVAKGTERQLRAAADTRGCAPTDLSWPEYSWLAATFPGGRAFSELPKMAANALSVEVLPGAPCQLRLAQEPASQTALSVRVARHEAERRDRELRKAFDDIAALAARGRNLLGREGPRDAPGQRPLGFGAPNAEGPAGRPRRRGRGQ